MKGKTEYDAIPVVARRLQELDHNNFSSLEALGIAVIDAEGDGKILKIASSLKKLGKTVFAIYDKQKNASEEEKTMEDVDHPFASPEEGFEKLIVNHIDKKRLENLISSYVSRENFSYDKATKFKDDPLNFLKGHKGYGYAADLLVLCEKHEIPQYITITLNKIKSIVEQKDNAFSISENNSPCKQ